MLMPILPGETPTSVELKRKLCNNSLISAGAADAKCAYIDAGHIDSSSAGPTFTGQAPVRVAGPSRGHTYRPAQSTWAYRRNLHPTISCGPTIRGHSVSTQFRVLHARRS
jgi:hypothetical protein